MSGSEASMRNGLDDICPSPNPLYNIAFPRHSVGPKFLKHVEAVIRFMQRKNSENKMDEKKSFIWPYDYFQYENKIGLILPTINSHFFFQKGLNPLMDRISSIKGNEKEGKWFMSARYRNKSYRLHLDSSEIGDLKNYLRICIKLCDVLIQMHQCGIFFADFSYKNILIDPISGDICLRGYDSIVFEDTHPPYEVLYTPDFTAPEIIATQDLDRDDPNRKSQSILTNRHSLAVFIYMLLLHRHPLKGGNCFGTEDPILEDNLMMGAKALFIEHPTDKANRLKPNQIDPKEQPWADINKIPYTLYGPLLKTHFDRAFIDGLHNPTQRPDAEEWKEALIKTDDLLQPCPSTTCEQKWFVLDNEFNFKCLFCEN
jgi:serine/threonine protein kinase